MWWAEFFVFDMKVGFTVQPNLIFVSRLAQASSVRHRRPPSKTTHKKEAALLRYTPESASTKAPSQRRSGARAWLGCVP